MEFSFQLGKHSIANPGIRNQRSVKLGNPKIRFSQGRFYIADQVNEERELARHGRQDRCAAGFLRIALKGMANREPRGDKLPALRPAKYPRNSAEIRRAGAPATA